MNIYLYIICVNNSENTNITECCCRSVIYKQNSREPRTDPCRTPSFVSRDPDVDDFENTHFERPHNYENIHCNDWREKPRLCSFCSRRFSDKVSKALEKSKWSSKVIILPSIPIHMSSLNLIKADCVLWCFLKPVWKVSSNLLLLRKMTIWSWASFSSTFERKLSKTIGLKSEGNDGTGALFRVIIQAFFQECENTPWASDALKSFVRWGTIVGSALAITLWGVPSSPLVCLEVRKR